MRAAIIRNGRVWNIIETDTLDHPEYTIVEADPSVSIGMLYDGEFANDYGDLAEYKAQRIAAINALRDAKEAGGFDYLGGRFDSDPAALRHINSAVLAAQSALAAQQPFSLIWTLADNSTMELSAEQLVAMPAAMALRGYAIHLHGRSLKAQVEAAETGAAVDAVDIESGWPT